MRLRSIFTGNGGGLGGTLGGMFGGITTAVSGLPGYVQVLTNYGVAQRYPHLPPEVLAAAQGLANIFSLGCMALAMLAGQVLFAYLFSMIGDMHAKNGSGKPAPPAEA